MIALMRSSAATALRRLFLAVILSSACLTFAGLVCPANTTQPSALSLPPALYLFWYQWQSPTRMLIVYETERKAGNDILTSYDVATHREYPVDLPVYTVQHLHFNGFNSWPLSPDGNWLLGDDHGERVVFNVGPQPRELHTGWRAGVNDARWARDGSGWLEWNYDGTAVQVEFRTTAEFAPLATDRQFRVSLPLEVAVVGLVDNDTLLYLDGNIRARGCRPELVSYNVVKRASAASHFVVIPGLLHVCEVILSPDGRQLSWITLENSQPFNAANPGASPVCARVWVSGPSGDNLTQLAMIDLPGVDVKRCTHGMRPPRAPRFLEWQSGSRGVSYYWDGRLWTLAVPERSLRNVNSAEKPPVGK